jgi:hypothetical protein
MEETEVLLGAALLRMYGDGASLGDARVIARALMRGELREGAAALANLAEDGSGRAEGAIALVGVMLRDFDAPVALGSARGPRYVAVRAEEPLALLLLQSRSSWHRHFERRVEVKEYPGFPGLQHETEELRMSSGLFELIDAAARLWGARFDVEYRIDVASAASMAEGEA